LQILRFPLWIDSRLHGNDSWFTNTPLHPPLGGNNKNLPPLKLRRDEPTPPNPPLRGNIPSIILTKQVRGNNFLYLFSETSKRKLIGKNKKWVEIYTKVEFRYFNLSNIKLINISFLFSFIRKNLPKSKKICIIYKLIIN
jgi:hypothetical protein